jgi:lactoylglutathione lyase
VVEDVQNAIENAINHGATLVEKAKVKPWGQTVGYVRDLDGFLIEVCTQIS